MRSSFLLAALGATLPVSFIPRSAAAQPDSAPSGEASPAPATSDPSLAVQTTPAAAQAAPPQEKPDIEEKSEKKDEDRSVYISFSPIHLLLPMFEMTGEVRVHPNFGLAGIAGIGSVKPEGSSTRFTVYELGGQFVGYPVGHFDHGMQLGVEVLYAGVSGATSSGADRISGVGQGLAIGPLVGYKFASKVGFSLNVQGGVQYIAMRAEASDTSGVLARAEDSSVIPLLNFNIG